MFPFRTDAPSGPNLGNPIQLDSLFFEKRAAGSCLKQKHARHATRHFLLAPGCRLVSLFFVDSMARLRQDHGDPGLVRESLQVSEHVPDGFSRVSVWPVWSGGECLDCSEGVVQKPIQRTFEA